MECLHSWRPLTDLTDAAQLDHFDHCLTPENRQEVWRRLLASSDIAHECIAMAHESQIQDLRRLEAKQRGW